MALTTADFVAARTRAAVTAVDYTADLTAQVRAHAPDGVDAVLHLAGDLAEVTKAAAAFQAFAAGTPGKIVLAVD